MAQFVYTMHQVSKNRPAETTNSKRHLIVFFPWGKDWRIRPEWLRQIDAAANHGRCRQGV